MAGQTHFHRLIHQKKLGKIDGFHSRWVSAPPGTPWILWRWVWGNILRHALLHQWHTHCKPKKQNGLIINGMNAIWMLQIMAKHPMINKCISCHWIICRTSMANTMFQLPWSIHSSILGIKAAWTATDNQWKDSTPFQRALDFRHMGFNFLSKTRAKRIRSSKGYLLNYKKFWRHYEPWLQVDCPDLSQTTLRHFWIGTMFCLWKLKQSRHSEIYTNWNYCPFRARCFQQKW